MYDMFTAVLLADLLSRRHFNQWRKPEREPQSETESPWIRVFAWHRRKTNVRI